MAALLLSAAGAAAGGAVFGRSKEKQAAATGQAVPGVIGEVVKALVKRK